MTRVRRLLAVLSSAAILGCPPDESAPVATGAQTSLTADGRSHVTVAVTCAGYEDCKGDVCVSITWAKDAVFVIDGAHVTQQGGTDVDRARVCQSVKMDAKAMTNIEIESQKPMEPGTFATVTIEQAPRDQQQRVVSAD